MVSRRFNRVDITLGDFIAMHIKEIGQEQFLKESGLYEVIFNYKIKEIKDNGYFTFDQIKILRESFEHLIGDNYSDIVIENAIKVLYSDHVINWFETGQLKTFKGEYRLPEARSVRYNADVEFRNEAQIERKVKESIKKKFKRNSEEVNRFRNIYRAYNVSKRKLEMVLDVYYGITAPKKDEIIEVPGKLAAAIDRKGFIRVVYRSGQKDSVNRVWITNDIAEKLNAEATEVYKHTVYGTPLKQIPHTHPRIAQFTEQLQKIYKNRYNKI